MKRQQRGFFFFFRKGRQKIDPQSILPRCGSPGVFSLRQHGNDKSSCHGRGYYSIPHPQPTPQSHFTGTGKNLFDLRDLLDPFGLMAGGSQSHRERGCFVFFPATCLTFYLPAECVRLCVQRMFAQLMLCRCQSTSKCFLSSATTVGDVSTHSPHCFFLHTQQGW